MTAENFLYLSLDLSSILFPFLFSFYAKAPFYKKWRSFFLANLIMLTFFIIWDVIFTEIGVWGFNPRYLTGIQILNLPIEEWLFFICIPYASIFSYEAFKYFRPAPLSKFWNTLPQWFLIGFCISIAFAKSELMYTFYTAIFLALFLFIDKLFIRFPDFGRFLVSYLFILIPFFLVNGILTGSFIEEQVVWYNNGENLGIRLGTIPVEDSFYGFLMLYMNAALMYLFNSKKHAH